MKKILRFGSILLASAYLMGCQTTFKVLTEPDQADVYLVQDAVEKPLGKTPLVKNNTELEELLKGQNAPGGLVNVVVKKDGFKSKNIWVPVNGGGSLDSVLNLKLEAGLDSKVELKTAQDILKKLFLSQQFARSQQLERALIEIDKVLEEFPEFDRAMTMKAAIYYAKGDFKESLKWYESAIAVNPELKTAVEMAAKVRQTLKLPTRLPPRLPASGSTDGGAAPQPASSTGSQTGSPSN